MAINTRLPYILLIIFIALHAAVTLGFSLTLRYELKSSGLDGTLFEQLLYNVIHGQGLVTTLFPPGTPQHWLGVHFSPILYALVPVYYLFPHMETLLVIHSIFIALTAWPIFLAAEYMLHSRWQALFAALLYLLNPFVISAAIWDFHEIAFAPFIIAFMLWAIVQKKPVHLVIFSLLLLTIKEHYGLAILGSGLLWAWHWGDARFGLLLATFGLAAMAVILLLIMPHYNINNTLSWADQSQTFGINRFGWLHNPFANDSPIRTVVENGFGYIIAMMIAFCFMPLTAPIWWLPGLADITANILSTGDIMRSVYSYHSAALQPVFIIASIIAIATYFKSENMHRLVFLAMTLASLAMSYKFVVDANNWERSSPRLTLSQDDQHALQSINRIIPENAAVSGQFNVLPHVKMREQLYLFPNIANADYIVLHTAFLFHKPEEVFDLPYGMPPKDYFNTVKIIFADQQWHVLFYENNWVVFAKLSPEDADARSQAIQALSAAETHYNDLLISQLSHQPR